MHARARAWLLLLTSARAPSQARQNSLYVVHDVDGLDDATEIRTDGLYLGGWSDVRPRVADSSVSDARFKFFLGATEWDAGQLEDELKAGAWLTIDCDPALVIKDRVEGWRPGRPKPVWTELLQQAIAVDGGEEAMRVKRMVYPDE